MLKKIFGRSDFSRDVITLTVGTAIAQSIPLVLYPVFSRILTTGQFGIFSIFSAYVAIISVLGTARYEHAIALPAKESDAINIFSGVILVTLAVSALTLLLVILFRGPFFNLVNHPELKSYSLWLPVAVLVSGIYQALSYWITRHKKFKLLSVARVGEEFIFGTVSISFGLIGLGGGALILGNIGGQIALIVILLFNTYFILKQHFPDISFANIRKNLAHHKEFAIYNMPHAVLGSFLDNGIIFMLTYSFGASVVGLYSLAFRLLMAPVGLIGAAIYQVYYPNASIAANNKEDLRPMILKIYKRLFFIGLPFFLGLFIFAPQLFSLIFGAKWHDAGVIAQILIPWAFVNFLISPVSGITLIAGKQKQAFLLTILDMLLRASALIIGSYYNDYKVVLILLSASCTSIQLFAVFWYYHIAGLVKPQQSDE